MAAGGAGDDARMVVLGRIVGVFGVRGWVKVLSDTDPREGILDYEPWYLAGDGGWEPARALEGQAHRKGLVARLAGCDDRDAAAALVGRDIAVRREQLPEPDADEVYWADLEGLRVQTVQGVDLGRIDRLFDTAANDVMVVRGERERLIPYLEQVVKTVDRDAGLVVVDWDPEF